MLKNRIYKIANNPSCDFFWHNGEKIVQAALSFHHILERHMCFDLMWSVTQILRNNFDRELPR